MKARKKLKKPKKRSITSLKNELRKWFSLYIRARDNYTCFTCGYRNLKGMQAGHYIPSSYCGVGLRYDEDNVHAQCYACNIIKDGNAITYRERMVEKYGEAFVKNLEQRRHEITKDFDYEGFIEKYKRLAQ